MSDNSAPQHPEAPQEQPAAAQVPPQQPAPGYAAPQQPAPAAPAGPLSPESDRQAAMWAHIGGVVGFLPSLIIWLMLKDRGPVTNVEAKEALNWQITFTIVYIAAFIVSIVLAFIPVLGWLFGLLPLAVWVVNVVFSILGGVKVNGGGSYRYPVNFRFIK